MKKLLVVIGLFPFIFLQCKDVASKSIQKLYSQDAVVISLSNPTALDSQTTRLFSTSSALYM
jgi:hypothetical protein